MIGVDTSLLAYAVNRHAPQHARASTVVDALVNGDRPWALPWPVVHEFVGVVTHPHATPRPLEAVQALGYVRALLESPSVSALGPTSRHAEVLAELLRPDAARGPARGWDVAAVLREHGVRELLSADAAMRRFAFLTVIDPLRGEPWSPGGPPPRRYRRLRPPGSRPA